MEIIYVGAIVSVIIGLTAIICSELEKLKNEHDKEMYEQGLDDAWKTARKICAHVSHGGLSCDTLDSIFRTHFFEEISHENTASEAIEKIRQYEKQKKAEEEKIKVGDEVIGKFGFFRGVVVGIDLQSQKASVLNVGYQLPQTYSLNCIDRTTGRHFSQILEVLEQLEGE